MFTLGTRMDLARSRFSETVATEERVRAQINTSRYVKSMHSNDNNNGYDIKSNINIALEKLSFQPAPWFPRFLRDIKTRVSGVFFLIL